MVDRWQRERSRAAMVDDDLYKAELVLAQLTQAREQTPERSLQTVRRMLAVAQNPGSRPEDIENAQANAHVAISKLAHQLEFDRTSAGELWNDAIRSTRVWRSVLSTT